MNTLETLKAAKRLISDSRHWTTEVFSRNSLGQPINQDAENAVSFCAVGALDHVGDKENRAYWELINQMHELAINTSLSGFNDSHTHSEVLDLFDKAIAKLESKP